MHPFKSHKIHTIAFALLWCLLLQCRPKNEQNTTINKGIEMDTLITEHSKSHSDTSTIPTSPVIKTVEAKKQPAQLPSEAHSKTSDTPLTGIQSAPKETLPQESEEIRPVKKDPVMKQDAEVLPPKKIEIEKNTGHDYAQWDAFLRKYVSADGRVMYKQIKRDMATLDDILLEWQKKPVQPSWSKEEKMAFWINVYNAYTIKKVASNYPVKSIMDLDKGKTWDIAFIHIGQKNYSLNDIENQMLRKTFNDARIHFALNCAAKSCPPLMGRAFIPDQLAAQLEERTRAFLSNSSFNTLETNKAEVSRIFEWYATDFDPLPDFLSRYGPVKLKPGTKVNYKPYNWALNE